MTEPASVKTFPHEGTFIRFCQTVADHFRRPVWERNLAHFDKVFCKFKSDGKCDIPIKSFIDEHRSTLEHPLVLNSDINDKWLSIPEGVTPSESKTLVPDPPRGVFLAMKDTVPSCSLPLAEVYQACVSMQDGELPLAGVTAHTVPAKFLYLFYNMLIEAEPENLHFKENAAAAEGLMIAAEDFIASSMNGLLSPDIAAKATETISSLMNGDGMKQMSSVLSGLMNNMDPDTMKSLTMMAQGLMGKLSSGSMDASDNTECVNVTNAPAVEAPLPENQD